MKPEQLFEEIENFVSESRSHLENGNMMEMAGLDDHVRTLCEMVLQLSEEQRASYAVRMEELLINLKNLGDDLLNEREIMAEQLKGVGNHKKASVAYRTTDSIDGFSDKKDDE